MNIITYVCNSNQLNWTAVGAITTTLSVITAFIAIFIQRSQFKTQRADDNERAFKTSSVTLITDFDKQFEDLEDYRFKAAKIITDHKIIEKNSFDYNILDKSLDDIYDFFDTLGYFVDQQYIKADLVHQYFYYWFSHYYEFYRAYNIKNAAGHTKTVWNNMSKLYHQLEEIESHQLGKKQSKITKTQLLAFFEEEAWNE